MSATMEKEFIICLLIENSLLRDSNAEMITIRQGTLSCVYLGIQNCFISQLKRNFDTETNIGNCD